MDLSLSELTTRLTTAVDVPGDAAMTLGIALVVSLALTLPRATWRWFGLVVTIVHEFGHGFAGLLTGRRIARIEINRDQSGATHSVGTGASAVWSGFWGYPFPAVIGAALVAVAIAGYAPAALAVLGLGLLASLLFMRGWLGWLLTLVLAAGAGWVALGAEPDVSVHVCLAVGMGLLVGAVKALKNLADIHLRPSRRSGRAQSDAFILARATRVPAGVWLLLFTAVIAACLLWAGWSMWTFLEAAGVTGTA